MFSPGLLEKNSSGSAENCSLSRNKFAVGINPLGDENQQNIRIQLAVHRFNNSSSGSFGRPVNDRSVSISPFKHTFLKNSQRYKSCESDKEDIQTNLKSFNQYQGVGNFPVIHLKKSTVISKPIRRSINNDFKIQRPELPFNRFLSHTPDNCLDSKASTRSVLDVLQDLSRKRIHTKDDTGNSKRKCKGLGGDSPLDIEAPYKPLFMSKNDVKTLRTRDSTTQTLETSLLDTIQTKKNESATNNEPEDPRAELRRRLARQNNEIFASLSSSKLSYPVKRISEKHTETGESIKQNGGPTKKTKYLVEENGEKNLENGTYPLSGLLIESISSEQSIKIEKKQKAGDGNRVSPNKDRLTAIFLAMQNVNAKAEVLGKNEVFNEKEVLSSSKNSLIAEGPVCRKSCTQEKTHSSTDVLQKTGDTSLKPAVDDLLKIQSNSGTKTTKEVKNSTDKQVSFESSRTSEAGSNIQMPLVNEVKVCDNKTNLESNILNTSKENEVDGFKKGNNSEMVATSFSATNTINSNLNFVNSSQSSTFKINLVSTVSSSLAQAPILSTGISIKGNSFPANDGITGGNNVNNVQDNVKNINHSVNDESKKQECNQRQSNSEIFKFGIGSATGCENQTSLAVQRSQSEANISEANNAARNHLFQSSSTINFLKSNSAADTNSEVTEKSFSLAAGKDTKTTPNTSTNSTSFTLTTITPVTTSSPVSQTPQSTPLLSVSQNSSAMGSQDQEKMKVFPFAFGQTAGNNSVQPSLFAVNNTATFSTVAEGKGTNELVAKNEGSSNQEKPSDKTVTSSVTGFQVSPFSFNSQTANCGEQSNTNSFVSTGQNSLPFKFGEKNENQGVKQNSETSLSSNKTAAKIFEQETKSNIFTFGQKSQDQEPPVTSSTQSVIGQANIFQQNNVFSFGQSSAPCVSSSNTTQISSPFGQNPSTQSNLLQQSAASQPNTNVNTLVKISSPFGLTSQVTSLNQSITAVNSFIQTTASTSASNLSTMTDTFTQNKVGFPTFGPSTSFGQSPSANFHAETPNFSSNSSQSTSIFGMNSPVQNSPFSTPFGENPTKQQNSVWQNSNFFMQPSGTQTSGFGQNSSFGSSTFGQKPATENNIFSQKNSSQVGGFGQNQSIQGSPFGQSSGTQTFGSQVPFSFTAPSTSATTSSFPIHPPSTSGSIFTFGSTPKTTSQSSSTFTFGSTSQPGPSSQSPFVFNSQQNNNTFKFRSSSSAETTNFGTGNAQSPFSFDAAATTGASEVPKSAVPVFSFGSSQPPASNSGFSFGATASPSVFSFGGSSSSTNSSTKFTFGATQPSSGIFTAGATPSPSTQVPLQGVFSIGSGSTQPRSRSSVNRSRRRT